MIENELLFMCGNFFKFLFKKLVPLLKKAITKGRVEV